MKKFDAVLDGNITPKITRKPFVFIGKSGKNEQGRRCCQHHTAFNLNAPKQEAHMAANSQYGDSTPESNTNWKSLGELARKLVEGSAK